MKCEVKQNAKREVKFSFNKEEIVIVHKFFRLMDSYPLEEWTNLEKALIERCSFVDLEFAYEVIKEMLIFMFEHQE